jgi:hypothetical protein
MSRARKGCCAQCCGYLDFTYLSYVWVVYLQQIKKRRKPRVKLLFCFLFVFFFLEIDNKIHVTHLPEKTSREILLER